MLLNNYYYCSSNLCKHCSLCWISLCVTNLLILTKTLYFIRDSKGCRRAWCKYDWFSADYKALIDKYKDEC